MNARRRLAGRLRFLKQGIKRQLEQFGATENYESTNQLLLEATVYELIFTVCSVLVGASCSEANPIPLEEHVGIMGCLIASQIEGAKWTEAHPNFYVAKYTCQPAKTFARI